MKKTSKTTKATGKETLLKLLRDKDARALDRAELERVAGGAIAPDNCGGGGGCRLCAGH